MKKLLFSIAMSLFVSVSTYAQLATFTLDDFENGLVNFTNQVNINPTGSFTCNVVDNPVTTGIDTSSKVWEWDRIDLGTNNVDWAGFWATLTNPIPSGYTSIEIKYMRSNSTSQLRIHCEGTVTKEFLPVTLATKTNEWETLTFDLIGNGVQNITVFGFQPDFNNPVDPNAKCYIDDIKVIYGSSVATGIFTPTVQKSIPAYYANSEITIPNYVGNVSVFDLTGKIVADGLVNNGKLHVTVEKGIYIVKTSIGNSKVIVQ